MTAVAVILIPAHVPVELADAYLALWWAGAAFWTAWGLFMAGRVVWACGQWVAWLRLRRLVAALLLALLCAAFPPMLVADETDLPPLPPTPVIYPYPIDAIDLPPGVILIDGVAYYWPTEEVIANPLLDCDWFPWALECMFRP